jgi:hypothetical protein
MVPERPKAGAPVAAPVLLGQGHPVAVRKARARGQRRLVG